MQLFNKRTSGSILTSAFSLTARNIFRRKMFTGSQNRAKGTFPNRSAFTLMELIIVIVVMGLLGKYGVEFMAQAYKGFIYSKINNQLQNQSATAVEFISKRISYRIKDSVIARKADGTTFTSIQNASGDTYTTLEWIGTDIDNFRGDKLPNWSGIMDLDDGNATNLRSPDTNTTAINNTINILSYGTKGIEDAAIYFVGSNSDALTSYGWDGVAITDHNLSMHPVTTGIALTDFNSSIVGVDFSGVDIYEYYKLAWTAYAIEFNDTSGDLTLHYNYQPWAGERFTTATDVKSHLIMQDVSSFQFRAVGSLIKVQVCVKSKLTGEEYSICKEKTVY